jgi:hypothetical protein
MYNRIKVLYIAGLGRSGSTLLAKLLGQLEGFTNVGEAVRYLFDAAITTQELPCSCGKSVTDCEFWEDIVGDIKGDTQGFAKEFLRLRHLPLLMSPVQSSTFRRRVKNLQLELEYLYASIIEKVRSAVIVDSSKHPSIAYVLSRIQNLELYVVHLVRDPRGVVYSWSTPKEYLPAAPPLAVTLRWVAFNSASELLKRQVQKYWLIRYEDLVSNPKNMLEHLGYHITGNRIRADFLQDSEARIDVQHALAGNPDKLARGPLYLEKQEWSLPKHITFLVSTLSFPLLRKYRYALYPPSLRGIVR